MEMKDIIGKRIIDVKLSKGRDDLTLETSDGYTFRLYHEQDCCESVELSDDTTDEEIQSLRGQTILDYQMHTERPEDTERYESITHTFYTLKTMDSTVVLRWIGESNGYYSEEVNEEVRKDKDIDILLTN